MQNSKPRCDKTYWFTLTWISVGSWAWQWSSSLWWWSVWFIWISSTVIIISIVHWRSTSWWRRLHVTVTSYAHGNMLQTTDDVHIPAGIKFSIALLHCKTQAGCLDSQQLTLHIQQQYQNIYFYYCYCYCYCYYYYYYTTTILQLSGFCLGPLGESVLLR